MSTQDIVVKRVFDAPVEEVWRAWSEESYVKQWWGPQGFTCPLAEMDFREGGTSLVCMSGPGFGDQYTIWNYEEIVPHERFTYTLRLSDERGHAVDPADAGMPPDFPPLVRNTVEFKTIGEGQTEVTVTEYDWPIGQMREMSEAGLNQCLDKMAAIFSSASATSDR